MRVNVDVGGWTGSRDPKITGEREVRVGVSTVRRE